MEIGYQLENLAQGREKPRQTLIELTGRMTFQMHQSQDQRNSIKKSVPNSQQRNYLLLQRSIGC
jgi:hypothetical protein